MSEDFEVGIDEVGRGALAGPVTVAVVAMPKKKGFRMKASGLRDSKRLTKKQRENWLDYIRRQSQIYYAVAHVQPSVIDRINVSNAANLAATRALNRLITNSKLQTANCKIFLDGGLFVDKELLTAHRLPSKIFRTVVRGDQQHAGIMLASIVAKCYRDRLLNRKALLFPEYKLGQHAGYGTEAHITALKRCGPTALHRLTFIKNFTRIRQYSKSRTGRKKV